RTLPSSSLLVATVVPWLTAVTASPSTPSIPSTFSMPVMNPSAGSAGDDGVFVVTISPVSSSTATTSVNVPPVPIPILVRLATPASCRIVGWVREGLLDLLDARRGHFRYESGHHGELWL